MHQMHAVPYPLDPPYTAFEQTRLLMKNSTRFLSLLAMCAVALVAAPVLSAQQAPAKKAGPTDISRDEAVIAAQEKRNAAQRALAAAKAKTPASKQENKDAVAAAQVDFDAAGEELKEARKAAQDRIAEQRQGGRPKARSNDISQDDAVKAAQAKRNAAQRALAAAKAKSPASKQENKDAVAAAQAEFDAAGEELKAARKAAVDAREDERRKASRNGR